MLPWVYRKSNFRCRPAAGAEGFLREGQTNFIWISPGKNLALRVDVAASCRRDSDNRRKRLCFWLSSIKLGNRPPWMHERARMAKENINCWAIGMRLGLFGREKIKNLWSPRSSRHSVWTKQWSSSRWIPRLHVSTPSQWLLGGRTQFP